jgi:hypothetical protein
MARLKAPGLQLAPYSVAVTWKESPAGDKGELKVEGEGSI